MVTHFEPKDFPPPMAGLLAGASTAPLGPGEKNSSVFDQLSALSVESAFSGDPVLDPMMAQCCISGLWLMHHYLEESHSLSKAIDTPEGCYWHGIMHRREPDYSNAKYWFRQTGDHPLFVSLWETTSAIASSEGADKLADWSAALSEWNPMTFVDLCEAVAGEGSEDERLVRKIAQAECSLLFDYCYRHAVGA